MSGLSAIEWTDRTWNPVSGCTRVTAGCDHCYAFSLHDQRPQTYQANWGRWSPQGKLMPAQYAQPFSTVRLLPERLGAPLHIRTPSRIFVNSMADLFHSQVPEDYIWQVFDVIRRARWHTFQMLTKRAGRFTLLGAGVALVAECLDWGEYRIGHAYAAS